MKRTLMLVCMIIIVYLQYGVVLFNDDFNRTEGSAVGNSWTNIGPVSPIIENSCMKVISNSLQGVRRDFTSLGITSGIYYVSFDWKITSNNWLADAFPNGTVTYLRHDYEGNLYYDNTSDFSNPITIGSLALNTWANFKLKVNIDTDRFSLWINNTLVADNIAGLSVTDFTRFTFRAGSGSTVTQYVDNFIVYNDTPPVTPTNLTATGAVNSITLNWTGTPQDFLTYKIYRKTTSPADAFLAEVPSTQTSYTDLTAAANTDYFYRVKAVSMGTIESGFSNEVTAHLQPDIAVTPQVINVTVGQGYTGEASFTIANNGNYPLPFNIHGLSLTSLNNGLYASYPFIGNANDDSGNGRNGTVVGATLTTDRFDNANNAYTFNGSSNYVLTNFSRSSIPNDATFCAWIYYTGLAGANYQPIFGVNNGVNDFFVGKYSGNLDVGVQDGTYHTFTGSSIQRNAWNFVAYVKRNNVKELYINGVLQPTSFQFSGSLTSGIVCIGREYPEGYYYTGKIDDVKIYSRSLTNAEIENLYSNGIPTHISLSQYSGTIGNAGQSQIVLDISAQSLTAGVYTDTLYVRSNDPDSPSIPVIVNLTVAPGDIVVAPTQFTAELNSASNTSNSSFSISNTGLGKLDYSISGTDLYLANLLPPIAGFTAMGVHNNHSYYRSNATMNWNSAKTLCEQNGGHLVSITSESENNFVYQNTVGTSWIGFTDEAQEGTWRWITNEPVSYTNWGSGEPNGGTGSNYAHLRWSNVVYGLDKWNDTPLNTAGYATLEIETAPHASILSFLPQSGTVETMSNQSITMSVNGSSLLDGLYNTSAMIVSNAQEPRETVYIPVTVKVDYNPPTAPLGLTFDEVQSDMNQIYLSWTANALADSVYSYKVFRRGLHDTLWSLKGTVDADHNWFIDNQFTGLDTTAVYYKLTAVDWVDNESAASDEVMAWLQRFPAPTGLTMEIIRDRHVQLTWNPVTQTISGNPGTPSCYVIYRSNTPSPIEDFYFVGAVDATTFTHNWAAWFIEIGKQFYVVTAYSGNFEDLRAVAESRSEWKYGELERAAFDYLTNIKRTK